MSRASRQGAAVVADDFPSNLFWPQELLATRRLWAQQEEIMKTNELPGAGGSATLRWHLWAAQLGGEGVGWEGVWAAEQGGWGQLQVDAGLPPTSQAQVDCDPQEPVPSALTGQVPSRCGSTCEPHTQSPPTWQLLEEGRGRERLPAPGLALTLRQEGSCDGQCW